MQRALADAALLAALACTACATAAPRLDVDGAPLAVRGSGKVTLLDDGALSIAGGPGYVFVEGREYRDVAVRTKFRADGGANSGVFVRGVHPSLPWDFYPRGIEAQIDSDGPEWTTGAVYGHAKASAPVGEGWHLLCVAVVGERVVVAVDDGLAFSAADVPASGSGFVALQAHDPVARVEFRELRIRALTEADRVDDVCRQPW